MYTCEVKMDSDLIGSFEEDCQTTKLNSSLNFPAIRYVVGEGETVRRVNMTIGLHDRTLVICTVLLLY